MIDKGDILLFGKYPQGENGEVKPIEWIILDIDYDKALLLSRYALAYKQFHKNKKDVTWEDCDLRKWLNYDFIKSAFSHQEIRDIRLTKLINGEYPEDEFVNVECGEDTEDYVFILSQSELINFEMYEENKKDILNCKPTDYAIKQAIEDNKKTDNGSWLLRSSWCPELDLSCKMIVYPDGDFSPALQDKFNFIRPALEINFNYKFFHWENKYQEYTKKYFNKDCKDCSKRTAREIYDLGFKRALRVILKGINKNDRSRTN